MKIKSFENLKKTWLTVKEILQLITRDQQDEILREYQGGLSLWAEHTADTKQKLIITLDGRDTAGKGSNIKRVTEQLNPIRFNTCAFWIPKPEEKLKNAWFERYEKFFPEEGKIRFFDRSWYNRSGVEAAMGFCTEEEYKWFMEHVAAFEKERIIDQWYDFLKIYLSIKKKTQKERLENRKTERKRWKSSPIDKVAQEKWDYYTLAKQKTLQNTDSIHAPWTIIDSNEKFLSAIEIIKMIISTSEDIRGLVENDLSIDLSPNKKIRRTAQEELARMRKSGEIPTKHKTFHFAQAK
jgi:polyphosphate kinase